MNSTERPIYHKNLKNKIAIELGKASGNVRIKN